MNFVNDQINEAQEGLIIRLSIETISAEDESRLPVALLRDTALLRIDDDDGVLLF